MSKRAWVVHRGRQFAAIYDGRGRTVAERVPLDMAERIAILPVLEAERASDGVKLRELLADILPLAMGASCAYNGSPEADRTQHCCDWSGVVEDIYDVLGREKPEDDAELCERVRREGGRTLASLLATRERGGSGPREFVVSGGDRGGHVLLRPLRAEEGST